MRILGITVPNEKRLEIGLTCFYGIGVSKARKILNQSGIDYGKRAKDLTADEENKIRLIVESIPIEGNLKREISANIKKDAPLAAIAKEIEQAREELGSALIKLRNNLPKIKRFNL